MLFHYFMKTNIFEWKRCAWPLQPLKYVAWNEDEILSNASGFSVSTIKAHKYLLLWGRQACPGASAALEHVSAPSITLTVHRATEGLPTTCTFHLQGLKLVKVSLWIISWKRDQSSDGGNATGVHVCRLWKVGQLGQNGFLLLIK